MTFFAQQIQSENIYHKKSLGNFLSDGISSRCIELFLYELFSLKFYSTNFKTSDFTKIFNILFAYVRMLTNSAQLLNAMHLLVWFQHKQFLRNKYTIYKLYKYISRSVFIYNR